jgi:ribonucleoside-triphosphate reductase
MASVSEIKEYRKENPRHLETTDMALFVRTSSEAMDGWDRSRIVDALLRETFIDEGTAEDISLEVENDIKRSGIQVITSPLSGDGQRKASGKRLEGERRMHTRLGVPLCDVDQLITRPNKENANVPHGPSHKPDIGGEDIKKEYALLNVFDQSVGDAHMRGDIHLHDLGFIDRPYCSGQSLEYIKKFGLNLPNSLAMAKPAKHPEVLLAHMVKFAAALQSHFAGAIGWDAVNLFFAPYLRGLPKRDVRQLAQMLIFEFSQQAVARGGQAIFTDINLY